MVAVEWRPAREMSWRTKLWGGLAGWLSCVRRMVGMGEEGREGRQTHVLRDPR